MKVLPWQFVAITHWITSGPSNWLTYGIESELNSLGLLLAGDLCIVSNLNPDREETNPCQKKN